VVAVLLTHLYLRNFRVYEEELDLDLPPGLVGIYGPNGAGKSTLLEAIVWALWGKARTTKEQVRSAGVGGDCIAELEFEHEGHLYVVRRSLTGINATPRLEVRCDNLMMSEGVRDAERYIEFVLGMDDGAFRASVFAEQKQLAAFSDRSPADRLRLVLRLLGITPLDAARDSARKDARQVASDHGRLRDMLPDLDDLQVEAADLDARAAAAEVAATSERAAADAAGDRLTKATTEHQTLDRRRQDHETLVLEGKAARQELDAVDELVASQEAELVDLAAAASRLTEAERLAADASLSERELECLVPAAAAAAGAERLVVPPEPAPVDESALAAAMAAAAEAAGELAGRRSLATAASETLERARQLAQRSDALSGGEDCPMCGQALGDAFRQVQAHRAAEVDAAEQAAQGAAAAARDAERDASAATGERDRLQTEAEERRRARATWEEAARRRADADRTLADAWAALVTVAPAWATATSTAATTATAGGRRAGRRTGTGTGAGTTTTPDAGTAGGWTAAALADEVASLRARVDRQRAAAAEVERLRGQLQRRDAVELSLRTNREKSALARGRLQTLREKVKALAFDADALKAAATRQQEATRAADVAAKRAQQAALRAAGERATAQGAATRLEDARAQHAKLGELESEARHLGRAADLLSEFRNAVVASVGPRLAVQAAELFGELTDHEYDELQVDPETYQLQISDGGTLYGLDRFSGSEIDLANLALRVAISEHIHFQSGGSVGLMVLDEVFGPLDEDRKARMLLALERLRGRFRQVLVVTHDSTIKEQLPHAIEVLKLPGRRATARLASG
jgi:exonuclease SbcC